MKIKRRSALKVIAGSGVAGLLGISAAINRGVRMPGFILEPSELPHEFEVNSDFGTDNYVTEEIIKLPSEEGIASFRAYAPEPKITITTSSKQEKELTFTLNNIVKDAVLKSSTANTVETTDGITRTVTIQLDKYREIELKWELPEMDSYIFGFIGDTGGDKELDWCLYRANSLGVRFFLHLGDFNYQEGDYERAIEKFQTAQIPCYITIGNHDFREDEPLHNTFLQNLGPLNNQFSIGSVRFVNLDTAANFVLPSRGLRGKLMERLIKEKDLYTDTVLFTHRPLFDPDRTRNHDVGNNFERDWLARSLHAAGIDTLLAGHLHVQAEVDYEGIKNYIFGQGLAYQDLIFNKGVSVLGIGRVDQNKKVVYGYQPLHMPLGHHCHPRTSEWREKNKELPQVKEADRLCKLT